MSDKVFTVILQTHNNDIISNKTYLIVENYTDTIKKIISINPIATNDLTSCCDIYVSPGLERVYLMENKTYSTLHSTSKLSDETIESIFMRCAIDTYEFYQKEDFFRDDTGNTCLIAYKNINNDEEPKYEY